MLKILYRSLQCFLQPSLYLGAKGRPQKKKNKKGKGVQTTFDHSQRAFFMARLREGVGLFSASIAVFIGVALYTFDARDPGWSHVSTHTKILNAGGQLGAFWADLSFALFGYLAYCFPVFFLLLAWRVKQIFSAWNLSVRLMGGMIGLIVLCSLTTLYSVDGVLPMGPGGLLGSLGSSVLVHYLNTQGATIVLAGLLLAIFPWVSGISWLTVMDGLGHAVVQSVRQLVEGVGRLKAWNQARHEVPEIEDFEDEDFEALAPKKLKKSAPVIIEEPEMIPITQVILPASTTPVPVKIAAPEPAYEEPVTVVEDSHPTARSGRKIKTPALSLLAGFETTKKGYSETQLQTLAGLLEACLREFGIEVKVVGLQPGPVVTRFELELAAGLKASKITGLSKDIARSLSVLSVRVVEVIPGKPVVGLEIPNKDREIVRLREILQSESYQSSSSPLTLALGKDISGRAVSVDLAKMPHLLVAGTTGSGKSVGINAMLLSILYKATPQDVRLILIDPKMLELAIYEGIPHLLTPVVTDMKDAAAALRWCVAEMELRYQRMAALGVRNLQGFNEKVEKAQDAGKPIKDPLWYPELGGEPAFLEKLPFVVVVIDEFADLMMVVGKKVEELIARLAQKARAAGIHLILATQRPSVDVITGLIKANIPTRMAFQVSSRIDSRTILDQQGAEQLLGHGDMLYLPPGAGMTVRVHGAFVADDEVHTVVRDLKKQGEPEYVEIFQKSTPSRRGSFMEEAGDEESDELYDQAVAIVLESRKASISYVQRRLKIGYNRAARLLEQMEKEGVVSAVLSNGQREIIVPSNN